MKTTAAVLTLAMLSALPLAQSALTGRWEGKTPNGAALVLDVTVQGEGVTGTLMQRDEKAEIAEGKVSKDTFTFKVTMGGRLEGLTGEVNGDQIRMWLDRRGPSSAAILTRAK